MNLEPLDSHIAMSILRDLLENQEIPKDEYISLSLKFKQLHLGYIDSCAMEESLLKHSRELSKELTSQKVTIEKSEVEQAEHRTSLTNLRQNIATLQNEIDDKTDQMAQVQHNTGLKQREYSKLVEKLEKANEDMMMKFKPEEVAIVKENKEIQSSIDLQRQNIAKLNDNLLQADVTINKIEEECLEVLRKKDVLTNEISSLSSLPVKLNEKIQSMNYLCQQLYSEEKQCNQQLQAIETTLQLNYRQTHDLEIDYQHLVTDLDEVSEEIRKVEKKNQQMVATISELKATRLARENEKKKTNEILRRTKSRTLWS